MPEIRWTKKGGALPQGRTTYDNYGKTLVIKHVDYEDEGDYTCEASNGVGIAKSYSISLAVHASPYFTKVSSTKNIHQRQSLSYSSSSDRDDVILKGA